jgi:hypothetical protein
MTVSLETEIRATLRECASLMPAEAAERITRIDYRPSTRRKRARLGVWSIGSGVGAAVAGCAVAAVLVFSSSSGPLGVRPLGVPMAYADWSATPASPTPAALAAAVAACNRIDSWNHYAGTPMLTGQPVLTEARGKYVAAIYPSGSSVNYCISDGHTTHSSTGGGTLRLYATPGPEQLGQPTGGGGSAPGFPGANPNEPLPRQLLKAMQADPQFKNHPSLLAKEEAARRALLDHGVESNIAGRAGRDIASATFVFANGKTVTATIRNGWYFAWWPNMGRPTSVQVTTTSGAKINSQLDCKPGAGSCVFAGINLQALPPKGTTTPTAPRPPAGVPMRTTSSVSPTSTTAANSTGANAGPAA